MKLYYSPGACSFSPHVALREAGLDFSLVKVSLATKKTEAGDDFLAINPKGYVPALQLDNGAVLTEGPAITQYIADLKPDSKLAPAAGTYERYKLQEWLTFIGTEIHKSYSALFNPKATDEWKDAARANILRRLEVAAKALETSPYLMGETFTVADGYLFTVLGWSKFTKVDLSGYPAIEAFLERVRSRPSVQEALKAEKLA